MPAPVVAAPVDGNYTVQRGDTLYGIAREFASDAGVSADQMMVALQRGNANAFFNDNINNLKAGVVLRIPDTDSARSLDRSDAAAEVRRQNDTWSSASAAPTLADAGAAPTRTVTPTPPPASDARLELVPPKGDTAGDSTSAGRAGNEQGGSDVAEVQSELQRTREDLQSRDQEVSELGSRVRDLEELNAKNARLLELKNAEVAELQRRLAEAGTKDAAEATATTEPAEHTSVDATAQSVDASVNAAAAPAATDEPANAVGESTTDDVVDGDATITEPATTAVDTSDTISSVGNETTGAAAAVPPAVAANPGSAGEEDVSEAEWEASATSAETDPFADTQDAAPATADTWAPGEPEVDDATAPPAQATTSVAAATTPVEPVSVAQPWYMQPMVQGAGLIGLALLMLLVMLARRQRKSAPDADTPKRSVSDLFVDGGPAAATGIGGAATLAVVDDVESEDAMALQAQIERDPDDFGAYLELLSLYYAEGDRSRFELWAERFYDRPGSEESMEWEQVEGMGEELLPDHPLFGGEDDEDDIESDLIVEEESQVARPTWMDEPMTPIAPPVATRGEDTVVDDDDIVTQQPSTPVSDAAHLSADDTRRVYDIGGTDFTLDVGNDDLSDDEDSRPIEFSLDDLDGPAPARPSPVSRAGDADEGDEVLPPLVFGGDEAPSSSYRDEPSADRGFVSIDADYDSPGDDGGMDDAATKLELARAYLDMGDPEGARAMLEEVLGEGDTSQRDEARKLLATL